MFLEKAFRTSHLIWTYLDCSVMMQFLDGGAQCVELRMLLCVHCQNTGKYLLVLVSNHRSSDK